MDTMTAPFADTYAAYWDAGWRGILPLPTRAKWPPPTGTTGHNGLDPSFADCAEWAGNSHHDANIALRLPDTVIGLDVDAYDDKPGADTITRLTDAHGPLPATVLSSSRGDGISGIRLYTIPPGVRLIDQLPGVEVIQRHHRYAVVWPSVHPAGGVYVWVDEATGTILDTPPAVDQLPALPGAWLAALSDTGTRATSGKAAVDSGQVAAFLQALPGGDPCRHVLAAAGKTMTGGARHDTYNQAVLAVVGRGRDGCPGALPVLQRLHAAFIAEISDRATPSEANAEWVRSLTGAVALAASGPLGPGVCPDDPAAQLAATTATTGAAAGDPAAAAYQAAVDRRVLDLRVTADARSRVAELDAQQSPPLTSTTLTDFLTEPDDPVRYRVDQLWPAAGRVLLVAAAKTGKTTMVGRNLLPALVDGGHFLNRFDTAATTTRRVALLNLEVGANQIRSWLRTAGITDTDRVLVANLRGRVTALPLATPQGRQRVADWLRAHDVDTVILDPLAPLLASLGLVEDSNHDVARFYGWWSETLADAGVSHDLICHHAGHQGDRSRGASRLLDEPDAIWTVTRERRRDNTDDDEFLPVEPARFLTAFGRDVDLPETALAFDPATGRLALTGQSAGQLRRQRSDDEHEARVRSVFAAAGGGRLSQRDIVRSGGNSGHLKSALDRLIARGEVISESLGVGRGFALWMPHFQGGDTSDTN